MDIIGIVFSFIYFYAILLISHKTKKLNEYSRKFAHIMIGNWYLLAIIMFDKLIYALITPTFFCIYGIHSIYYSKKDNIITSLLRKSKESATGIILFPISLIVMLIISFFGFDSFESGGIGVMALTYGDSMAALIGTNYPILSFKIGRGRKSLSGCFAMCFFSVISIYLYNLFLADSLPFKISFLFCIILGCVASLVEIITPSRFDNLTIPILVFLVYVLFGIS